MRQLHINESESGKSGEYSSAVNTLATVQLAGVGPARELLVDIEQSQPSTETLLNRCSRDNPVLELLNLGTYFSSAVLVMLLPYFVTSGSGAASVLTVSTLIGMNYSMRRAIKRGYAKDADLFAELGPETVDRLIGCMAGSNARIEAVAAQVLAQLLPTFTKEQFENIPGSQRLELFRWLRDGSPSCTESKITVLRWLVDVADSDAIEYIEQVAKTFPLAPARRRLRKEANRVLSLVLERIDKEDALAEYIASAQGLDGPGTEVLEEEDLETTEESRALLTQIRKNTAKRTAPGMRMGYLIANWCFITPYVAYKFFESISMRRSLIENIAWLVGTAASTQLFRLSLTPAHTRMARQLANTSDPRAVGALAEALEWPDEEIQAVARGALIRLLPKLTSNDAPLLGGRQRRCLNNRLVLVNSKNYLDSELQVKILQALEKVGDTSSLQVVRSLTKAKAVLTNERKVQKAAIQCLPLLEACAALNESSLMLLRASGIESAATDTLVRPASAKEAPDEELLRPSE